MDYKFRSSDHPSATSTRHQSLKIDSLPRCRPKPVPSLRSSTADLDQENLQPSNELSSQKLSASSECSLRRTTELPFPKPTRSLSVSDGLVADRRPSVEDDITLKLATVPGHSLKAIAGHQVRAFSMLWWALRAYKSPFRLNLAFRPGHKPPVWSCVLLECR